MKRLDNGNIELTINILWAKIVKAFDGIVLEAVAAAELPGFRKGKAPRKLVEDKLRKSDLYLKAVERLLPDLYSALVKEHKLKPILSPRISLVKADEGQDWTLQALVCEAPVFELPKNWEKDLAKVDKEQRLTWLGENTSMTIPDLLSEEEANHRMAALVENITKLGLTTDGYLASKKITATDLKAGVIKDSRNDLKIEFILETVKTEKKLENRQKILEFLQSLV